MYHLKDYDHPIRNILFLNMASHDNDLEGLFLRVSKSDPKKQEALTWYHGNSLLYTSEKPGKGAKGFVGQLHQRHGRPIVYVQEGGHGVRALQAAEVHRGILKHTKIYHPDSSRPGVTRSGSTGYRLKSFEPVFDAAMKGGSGLFADKDIDVGGKLKLPKYFDGTNGVNGVARPKPPWNWQDGMDAFGTGRQYLDIKVLL